MDAENVHVVLVHGTRFLPWAKPSWIESGELVNALDERGITHEPFRWSGFNGHRARMKAADRLASTLESTKKRADGRSVCVIAHSHGGNVALHASLDEGRPGEIESIRVISLATPFIHYRKGRGEVGPATMLGGVLLGVLAVFGAALPLLWVIPVEWGTEFAEDATLGGWLWAVASWSLVVLFVWGPDGSESAKIQAPSVDQDQLTVMRAVGDEASLSLAASQVLHSLGRFGLAIAATLFFLGIGVGQFGVAPKPELWAGVLLAVVATALIQLLLPCAFGLDGLGLGVDGSLYAESTPPGNATVIQLSSQGRPWRRLAHSSLYQGEAATAAIIEILDPGTARDAI